MVRACVVEQGFQRRRVVFAASRTHLTDSHQSQQDNRLTFVKIGCADLRMLGSDFGRMPSPGSAALNCAAAAEKVLLLPLPLHGKRLHQVFYRQVRWYFPSRMAWHYKQYARDQAPDERGAYVEAEVAARDARAG